MRLCLIPFLCSLALAQVFIPDAAREHQARVSSIDVQHYRLDISLDLEAAGIEGSVRVDFKAAVPGLQVLELDAHELTIRGVFYGDQPLGFEHSDGVLRVELLEPLALGQQTSVRIDYGGTPRNGLHFVRPGPLHPDLPYQVHSQGECEDSSYWFPCYDFPNDRASHEMHVTVQEPFYAVAAGELLNVELLDGQKRRFSYRMETPHPVYLTTVVAGDYVVLEDTWRGKPVRYVVEPVDETRARRSFGRTPDMLEFFSELLGVEYPYSAYTQTCVRRFGFGGMENISATTQTRRTLHSAWDHAYGNSDGLVAHELAHQWFGDLVTCSDWSHIWLNEGFATYFTQLWFEQDQGLERFQIGMRDTQNSYKRAGRSEKRRPVVYQRYQRPIELFFDGTVYPGGAARLHMLRGQLGDEVFYRAIHHYLAKHREDNADTDDFRKAVEESSGKDLATFFEQWFYKPGFPDLDVRWSYVPEAGMISLRAEQTQSGEGGRPLAFELPVQVEVTTAEGVQQLLWPLRERTQTLYLPVSSEPLMVRFDKGHWLVKDLDFHKRLREWLYQLQHDSDAAGRLAAAEVLAAWLRSEGKTDKGETHEGPAQLKRLDAAQRERVLAALCEAAGRDSQERVRRACLDAVRAGKPEQVLDTFLAALQDPLAPVRRSAVEALVGLCKEHDQAYESLQVVLAGEDPVLAAAALRGVAQRADWDALQAQLEDSRVEVRRTAFDLLYDRDRERCRPLVLHFAAPGTEDRLRSNALGRLADFPGWQPGLEVLRRHLDDPYLRWRSQAARALAKAGDASDLERLVAAWQREQVAMTRSSLEQAIADLRRRCLKEENAPGADQQLANELRAERAEQEARLTAVQGRLDALRAEREALERQKRALHEEMRRLGVE